MAPLTVHNIHTWATFVLPSVNVTPNTRKLIETVMPYFPHGCRCITGYQDDEAQYWKEALGATLTYNEKSHVHVEFANGVKLPK